MGEGSVPSKFAPFYYSLLLLFVVMYVIVCFSVTNDANTYCILHPPTTVTPTVGGEKSGRILLSLKSGLSRDCSTSKPNTAGLCRREEAANRNQETRGPNCFTLLSPSSCRRVVVQRCQGQKSRICTDGRMTRTDGHKQPTFRPLSDCT